MYVVQTLNILLTRKTSTTLIDWNKAIQRFLRNQTVYNGKYILILQTETGKIQKSYAVSYTHLDVYKRQVMWYY